MIWWLLACHKSPVPPPEPTEALPISDHLRAESEALAWNPDRERGGPALHPGQSPLPPFKGVSRKTATYLGSSLCKQCHASQHEVWSLSGHAHAMTTLANVKRDHDPDCLRCHFTGFQQPGFALTKTMAEVGCESCHGPGSDHAAAPHPGYGELPTSAAACVACHTHDNSPDFRWNSYWPKIEH